MNLSRVPRPACRIGRIAFWLACVLLAGSGTRSAAQQLPFRQLTVDDGLAQSHVEAIVQDHSGFIWLATAAGLSRYDGFEWKTLRHDPEVPASLPTDDVRVLHVDDSGRLWVGTRLSVSLYDAATDEFRHWVHDPTDPSVRISDQTLAITSDASGAVWVGGHGVSRIDPETGSVALYDVGEGLPVRVWAIHEDSRGDLWFGAGQFDTRPGLTRGLFRLDRESDAIVRAEFDRDLPVVSIAEDARGGVWVGTWGGGAFYRESPSQRFVRRPIEIGKSDRYVRQIVTDPTGPVWMIISATDDWYLRSLQSTLVSLDLSGSLRAFPAKDASEVQTAAYLDRTGVLWVGSSGSGVHLADTRSGHLSHLRRGESEPVSLSSDFVRAIHAEENGTLWVGTPSGLDRIDRLTGRVDRFRPAPGGPETADAERVEAVLRDRTGDLWVGTQGGLSRMRSLEGGFKHFLHEATDESSLACGSVRFLFEDSAGTLWIGTASGGLNRFDRSSGTFTHLQAGEETHWRSSLSIIEDSLGRLWLGTGYGLARVDISGRTVVRYGEEIPVAVALRGIAVNVIAEDRRNPGVLWLGTGGRGLVRFDPESGETLRFERSEDGLPHSNVVGILVDDAGYLWISTLRGFVRFDPRTDEFRRFGPDRGLQSLEFNRNAYYLGPDGEMFFGGVGGLNAFRPEELVDNPHPPQVAVSRIVAVDRSAVGEQSTESYSLDSDPGVIELSPRQRDVRFEFSAVHFSNPQGNRLSYRLEGHDTLWTDAGPQTVASYTNLPYGSYTFWIRAASAHGVWTEKPTSLQFVIARPFWRTTWFITLCVMSVASLVLAGRHGRVRYLRRRQEELQLEVDERTRELRRLLGTVEEQAEELSELSEAKSRFVANISHELRTPLTLLGAPLEALREGVYGEVSEEALGELDVVIRSARRLRHLVDQLLLVSRLEAGEARLTARRREIVDFTRGLALDFAPLAERRNVELRTDVPLTGVELWFDADLLTEVMSNLLVNAFKYTPEGGQVLLRVRERPDEGTVTLEVKDNGEGISPEHLPHIFERFYRGEKPGVETRPGTGIGLSVAKELTELHRGEIAVESEPGFGSAFTVTLRVGREHFSAAEVDEQPMDAPAADPGVWYANDPLRRRAAAGEARTDTRDQVDRAIVLVVEDNPEIRHLLRRQLRDTYRVLEAPDGVRGLELARSSLPDLIISDILMPRMDGQEFCRTVKSDPALEFIPVVLLTAKASQKDKLSGLEGGADDYISKPFDVRELRARLANLIAIRQRLKARVEERGSLLSFQPPRPDLGPSDAGFLRRVQDAVNAHLSEDDFGVEELANVVHMSRIHLYRRVREICGKTPSELIMETRLEVAADLLRSQTGSVSEVAYGVGFKSVSHFARRFRSRYDQTPSAFRAGLAAAVE